MRIIFFAIVVALSLHTALAGAGDSVLVEGHGIEISEADVALELQLLTPAQRSRVLEDSGELQNTITRIFFRRRMAQLAEEYGYLDEELVQARLRLERENTLGQLVPQRFVAALDVPDLVDEARQYYEDNLPEFTPEETIRARHILLKAPSPEDRARRMPEAEQLLERARSGEDFGELAAEYSEDGSRFLGGDLGHFGLGKMVPEFEEVAFALTEEGELSDVVETRFGLHLIQLSERSEARPHPFKTVRKQIVERLTVEFQERELATWLRTVASPSVVAVDGERLDGTREALRMRVLESSR